MATGQPILDTKIATAAASSLGGGAVTLAHKVNPVIDAISGIVSIVAAVLAIWWTIERLIELKKEHAKKEKERKDDED